MGDTCVGWLELVHKRGKHMKKRVLAAALTMVAVVSQAALTTVDLQLSRRTNNGDTSIAS